MRCSIMSSTSVVKVRTVPCSSQLSGITLVASPAWIMVTEITAASIGLVLRLTMVWKACTIWQAAGTGSMPRCGMAPWPPLPRIVILNSEVEAITGPGLTANLPTSPPGQLCMPNTASIGNFSNRPSLIISRAPPPPSSAGWKIRYTVPSKLRFFARCCAAASSIAVWPSWPQACILPWSCLAWAKVLSSVTGSASMSARRPTARALVPFLTMPTTPVVPSPRWIGIPHSVSLAATTSAVRASSKQSSGWACRSRRTAAMPAAWVTRESMSFMGASLGFAGSARQDRAPLVSAPRLRHPGAARGQCGVGEVGEHSVHAEPVENQILVRRIALVVRRQPPRLVAEGERVHEQPGLVGVRHQRARRARHRVGVVDLAVAVDVDRLAIGADRAPGADDVALPRPDAVRVGLDLCQTGRRHHDVEVAAVTGLGPFVGAIDRHRVGHGAGLQVDAVAVDQLHRLGLQAPGLHQLEAAGFEGLDEDRGAAAVPSGGLEHRDQLVLQRQAEVAEIGRVLGLGVDADGAAGRARLGLGEVDHLLEGRHLVLAVELL